MGVHQIGRQDNGYQQASYMDQMSKETKAKEGSKVENGSAAIFAGNLNLMEDPIARKREEARKEAMGLLIQQFKTDSDIDADMVKRNDHIDETREEGRHAREEVARLEEERERLKKEYGLEEGSEELLGIQKEITHWKKQQGQSENTVCGEVAVVRATKKALLERTHDMTDVAAAAEDIMDSAKEEIIGLLAKEAVDKIEEEQKEEKEKTEAAEEKKEKQEELIYGQKEQEQIEQMTRQAIEADSAVNQEEINRRIQEILKEQKLLEEDMKGIAVDSIT